MKANYLLKRVKAITTAGAVFNYLVSRFPDEFIGISVYVVTVEVYVHFKESEVDVSQLIQQIGILSNEGGKMEIRKIEGTEKQVLTFSMGLL